MPEQKMILLDADYIVKDNIPIVRLYGRAPDGKSIILFDRNFEPYFYLIPKSDPEKLKYLLEETVFDLDGKDARIRKAKITDMNFGIERIKAIKVSCHIPGHVPKIKDIVKDWPEVADKFEFDILFFRRYLMDKSLIPMDWVAYTGKEATDDLKQTAEADRMIEINSIKHLEAQVYTPKTLAFDLETVPEGAKQKIILASVYTADYKKVICYEKDGHDNSILVKDEMALIEKLIDIIREQDPDFLITYNGDAFDMTVLKDRASRYKIPLIFGRDKKEVEFRSKGRSTPALVTGRPHIDLFPFISVVMRATISSEVLTLNAVAEELLGEKKIDMTWEEMLENWREKKNLKRFAEYCLHDSYLTWKLANLITPNIFALSRLTGQTPADVTRMTYGQLVESYAIKRASSMDIIVPNRPTRDEIDTRREEEAFVGAFVVEPKPGLHENIALFDFRSLYPSIIVSHNVDPSTFNCKEIPEKDRTYVPGTKDYFCSSPKGFIPTVLEDLVNGRAKVKSEMKKTSKGTPEYTDLYAQQYALKTVSNAFYGYLGFAGSRWYRRECGESVTAFGRHYIHSVIDTAKSHGFETIYGDTDSVFLKLIDTGKDLKKVSEEFLKDVNSKLPGIMELEFEGNFKRGIFVKKKTGEGGAKKRYALIDDKGNLTIRGFEKVRRDWSDLAKNTQEQVLRMVLEDKVQDAVEYVKKVVIRLKEGKVPLEELGIYTSVKRGLDDYDQVGPHVKAAMKAEARGVKIHPGTTIRYVITSCPGSISDKAELIQFAKDYDKDYYIKKQIIPAAMRALSVFGVTEDELEGNGRQTGLFSFASKTRK